jgi:hypothetical protein
MIVNVIYWLLVLVAAYTSIQNAPLSTSISGFIAPFIAWFGGSGMRGGFYGTKSQKIAGIVLGILFLVIASYWISSTGFYVTLFEVTLGGGIWVAIGFLIGLIFTSKRHAVIDDDKSN